MNRLRLFIFGRDENPYFDVRQYANFMMAERTLSERFMFRWILPITWPVATWIDKWDLRFRCRYKDQWPARRANGETTFPWTGPNGTR